MSKSKDQLKFERNIWKDRTQKIIVELNESKDREIAWHQRAVAAERALAMSKHPSNGNVTNITDASWLRPRTYVASKTVKNPKERRVQLTVTGTNGQADLWVNYRQYAALAHIAVFHPMGVEIGGDCHVRFLPVSTADVSGLVRRVNEILGRPVVYAEVL